MKLDSAFRRVVSVITNIIKNLLLKNKIAIIFSILVTGMLVIQGNTFYSYSFGIVKNEVVNESKRTIEQVSLNIDTYSIL